MNHALKKLKVFIFLVGLLSSTQAFGLDVGEQFRFKEIRLISGQALSAETFTNKYLIIEVWATWCPYCHRQNANLEKLHQLVSKSNTDLEIIAISVDKDPHNVEDYMKVNEFNFPVAMMSNELSAMIGKRRGIPELYVIDRAGKVVQKDYGLMVTADFEELIRYSKK